MQKFITTFSLCFILTQSFCQTQRKVSTYLQGQYNKTIYDRTIGNNPWGMGLGLQLFLTNNSKLKPTIDLTADAYLEDDKVFRMNSDGTEIVDIGGMVNVFAGASFYPTKTMYLSLVSGPSFVSGQTLLAMKPSFGFYFSEKQRWTGKVSYINVFNRDKKTKEDFGSISLSLGVKLF
ncbi:hypothetical protein ACFSQD_00905 [Flavihumibacter stibioxidans]|uniref:Outer membrane protein beta-barrel domain-containing protein n=1 Tax=Flavihumibacter stibioxidans TaxID=1834163 RepID=A0ABR7M7I6_9BACT|nr:hypothetical protein [Flavihumibacter stibioxidans]MBC6490690.1 hypothetical protein [Flavihumibacter stibioxidans]